MPWHRKNEPVQVLLQLASGVSVFDVAKQFSCHKNTVLKLRQRYEGSGKVRDQPRTGRPRVTTVRQDRFITLSHLRNRFKTATNTVKDMGINRQTVVNRLRHNAQPLRARRLYVCPILNHRHLSARVAWARRHVRWTRAVWSRVLFHYWVPVQSEHGWWKSSRIQAERWTLCPELSVWTWSFWWGSVVVWGGIMGGRKRIVW